MWIVKWHQGTRQRRKFGTEKEAREFASWLRQRGIALVYVSKGRETT